METQIVATIPFPRLAYSLAESEALSSLSRSTLYRLIAAGKLKTVLRGRRRLVPASELERFIRENDTAPNHSDSLKEQ
jgi:excisionase family DNA binding protein